MKLWTTICRVLVWSLWCVIVVHSVAVEFFLSGGRTAATPLLAVYPMVLLLLPAGISAIVRWLVIPRWRHPMVVLVATLVGLVFAEWIVFFGIFLIPSHRLLFFAVGLAGIVQFFPLWTFGDENKAMG